MNPICFYHKADLDGVCSAAIVKHFVPECELYGIDYGDEFPLDKVRPGENADTDPLWSPYFKRDAEPSAPATGTQAYAYEVIKAPCRVVYMVDFSLPYAAMRHLAHISNLIWIDHHKTAIAECMELGCKGVQYSGFAACELTWAWFGSLINEGIIDLVREVSQAPEAVRLLGRYDVFDKSDMFKYNTQVLPFQYGMRSFPSSYVPDSILWQCSVLGGAAPDGGPVNTLNLAYVKQVGNAILTYQAEQNRMACKAGMHVVQLFPPGGPYKSAHGPEIVGWTVLACNTTVNNSQFFDGFFDPEKHDVMCAFCQRSDGKWKVSLYTTKDDVDCGEICKALGGGGHKKAAGFTCEHVPWGTTI